MEAINHSINTYQKNQNLAEWVQQTGATKTLGHIEKDETEDKDLTLSISQQTKIYEWIAHSLPEDNSNTVNLGRIKQALFDYQLLNIEDINMMNKLPQLSANTSLLEHVDQERGNTTSFIEIRSLDHIRRVFSTLAAASQPV